MYTDTITLFNLYQSSLGDMWYPTILHNVYLSIDRAAIIAKYGAESKDNAILHVQYEKRDDGIYIANKKYLPPKEWDRQTNDTLSDTVTFSSGTDFDFFIEGEWKDNMPISDNDYPSNFYNYMNSYHDNCFRITSAAKYTVIPHFEIMGA